MKVIVEISGRNQEFFREMEREDLVALCGLEDMNARHKGLWDKSKPVAIESTGQVDYVVVDNQDDPDLTRESWGELREALEGD